MSRNDVTVKSRTSYLTVNQMMASVSMTCKTLSCGERHFVSTGYKDCRKDYEMVGFRAWLHEPSSLGFPRSLHFRLTQQNSNSWLHDNRASLVGPSRDRDTGIPANRDGSFPQNRVPRFDGPAISEQLYGKINFTTNFAYVNYHCMVD